LFFPMRLEQDNAILVDTLANSAHLITVVLCHFQMVEDVSSKG